MDLYREEVMEHYEHPRNQGEIANPDFEGKESNASCGDIVQFQIKVIGIGEKQVISEVKWKGIGCAITTAAASKLSEWLVGKRVLEIRKLEENEILEQGIGFTVNPGRMKCLTLPVKVVKQLLGS